jgi:hypothetical protein
LQPELIFVYTHLEEIVAVLELCFLWLNFGHLGAGEHCATHRHDGSNGASDSKSQLSTPSPNLPESNFSRI